MLKIDLTGNKKTVDEILAEHDIEISRESINVICDGIDEGLSAVLVLQVIMNDEPKPLDFKITKSMYMIALRVNMEPLIIAEEYEICAKAKRYMEILSGKYLEENLVDSK